MIPEGEVHDDVAALPPAGRSARLRAAALSAEQATGEKEKTREQAKRHVLVRLALALVGTMVTLAGLAMLVLPGPGIVVVILGLGILAQVFPWAERLLTFAKQKSGADKVKDQPRWVKAVMVVASVAAVGASVAWVAAS